MKKISVAIVTRMRITKLALCLDSLSRQTIIPQEIIVIDNDSRKSSLSTVKQFMQLLPIKYYFEPIQGIPQARNKALNKCNTDYLGFIDDDCILNKNWVEAGMRMIFNSNYPYIVGKTKLHNPKSLISRAQYQSYIKWFYTKVESKTNKLLPQNLDTKNLMLNMEFVRKYSMIFDTRFNINPIGGGEDVDFGLQFDQHKLNGYYCSQMILSHAETDNLKGMISKAYYRGKSSCILSKKWKMDGDIVNLNTLNFLRWIYDVRLWYKDIPQIKNYSLYKKLIILLLTKLYDRIHLQGFADQKNLSLDPH